MDRSSIALAIGVMMTSSLVVPALVLHMPVMLMDSYDSCSRLAVVVRRELNEDMSVHS